MNLPYIPEKNRRVPGSPSHHEGVKKAMSNKKDNKKPVDVKKLVLIAAVTVWRPFWWII